MSHLGNQSKEEDDFEEFLADEGFEKKAGDFYECPGMHLWHEDDVVKLYEQVKGGAGK